MVVQLSTAALNELPDNIVVPAYDRASLTPGIVHIGVGNFHRAHQAVYLDKIFGMGIEHDWAVIGAGVRSADARMRDDLAKQDWLTTVVELDPTGLTARICGSMIGFVEPTSAALIEALSAPEIRIVSLTITEGGYFVDAHTGGFAVDHPDIAADIVAPGSPRTVFGIIVAALAVRRENGIPAFTVMSCDNLPENGRVTGNAVLGLAEAVDSSLAAWITENATFPSSMVDCIAPVTGERERAFVTEKYNIVDARPVTCEPFRQWVLEDKFAAGRPALEKAGVEIVDDVAPYELMKLRILNGGHASIAYPAALMGINIVSDAMANPLISGFLRCLAGREIIPTVPVIPGVDFDAYFAQVIARFSNSAVRDTIPRLCQDGSNRQPKFILPTIEDRLSNGLPVPGLALEVALWCRYATGIDAQERTITIDDPNADRVTDHAIRARTNPAAFLELESVFGTLRSNDVFRREFASALNSLWQDGVAATLAAYIDNKGGSD